MPRVKPFRPELDDLADPAGRGVLDDRRDVGLQVGAGAERLAGAGQDRDVDRVVVAEVGPRLDHQPVDVGVDRVARLGPVDRHVGDPVALLVEQPSSSALLSRLAARSVVDARGSPPGRPPPRRPRRRTTPPGPRRATGSRRPPSSGVTLRLGRRPRRRSPAPATARAPGGTGRACRRRRGGGRRAPTITRSQGPSGSGSSIRARRTSIPQLARLEDHLRLGVEPGDLARPGSARAAGGSSRRSRRRAPAPARARTGSPRSSPSWSSS